MCACTSMHECMHVCVWACVCACVCVCVYVCAYAGAAGVDVSTMATWWSVWYVSTGLGQDDRPELGLGQGGRGRMP